MAWNEFWEFCTLFLRFPESVLKFKVLMLMFYIVILSIPCSFPSLYLVYRSFFIRCTLDFKQIIWRLAKKRFFGSVFNKHIAVFFFQKGKIYFRKLKKLLYLSGINVPVSLSCILTLIATDSIKEREFTSQLCNIWQIFASFYFSQFIVFVTLSIVFR